MRYVEIASSESDNLLGADSLRSVILRSDSLISGDLKLDNLRSDNLMSNKLGNRELGSEYFLSDGTWDQTNLGFKQFRTDFERYPVFSLKYLKSLKNVADYF